jgi:putative transposase
MRQSRFSQEQMRKAIQQLEAGRKAEEVGRELGLSKQTLYAWRPKYGGLERDDLERVKDLEEENRRLKSLVADLSLDRKRTTNPMVSESA